MDTLNEAHRRAMEARREMLDARPQDTIPPLPDATGTDDTGCVHYYTTAADLYFKAAAAYAAGDVADGHTFELWAFQYITMGQACEAQLATRE